MSKRVSAIAVRWSKPWLLKQALGSVAGPLGQMVSNVLRVASPFLPGILLSRTPPQTLEKNDG